ncbi:hypothetical protein KW843_07570 [Acidovorax sp. sif1233]|uniref:hypothetical protein n=1 Tax=Acidovorax sp. sif1233 TaxID=2854792 RepID=UPI001C46A669|nr:hypothetical protein [Acidovorax sp. sif1233]MBV7454325.1 hypothetical protein [Acidovorax sp. sif1233]
MKARIWWGAWKVLAALQGLGLLAISGLVWLTGRVQRGANAAQVEMLLARAEGAIAAQRERRARPRRGGGGTRP